MTRDLGDGLVLRRASAADAEGLVQFNGRIHADGESGLFNRFVAAWTHDLIARPHPTFRPDDFTIVEDTRSGAIVSSLNLISQRWSYGGIPFGVGQIEAVGTDPTYRRRGLVRAQFALVHELSRQRGELVQSISGIPWYYRQFGYEYALDMISSRTLAAHQIPPLVVGRAEPFRLRPAAEADLGLIAELDKKELRRYLVAGALRDLTMWRYELSGRAAENLVRRRIEVIEDAAGRAVGYTVIGHRRRGARMPVGRLELVDGVSWPSAMPSILRGIAAIAQTEVLSFDGAPFGGVTFYLGTAHPAYDALPDRPRRPDRGYAWYIRVEDQGALVRQIASALEENLSRSPAAGHTGAVWLDFYRSGLRLTLERGRLTGVESTAAPPDEQDDVSFPDLVFLQLLFGFRSFEELAHTYPDVRARRPEARHLIECLFPPGPASVWHLG